MTDPRSKMDGVTHFPSLSHLKEIRAYVPSVPQSFSPLTHRIGIPDISDQTLVQYMKLVKNPNSAMRLARIDKIWLQVAREYGVLNGDSRHDSLLWEDHHLYMQGAIEQDPIESNDNARSEFLVRVMRMMGQ